MWPFAGLGGGGGGGGVVVAAMVAGGSGGGGDGAGGGGGGYHLFSLSWREQPYRGARLYHAFTWAMPCHTEISAVCLGQDVLRIC